MTASKSLRALREAIVLEHLESENEHEFEAAVGAFDHPRFEVAATGEVFEGRAAVAGYYARTRAAWPDQRSDLVELHHADAAVIVELRLAGTLDGQPVGARTSAFFLFDGARLVGKRLYGAHPGQGKSRHPVAGMAAPLLSDGNRT